MTGFVERTTSGTVVPARQYDMLDVYRLLTDRGKEILYNNFEEVFGIPLSKVNSAFAMRLSEEMKKYASIKAREIKPKPTDERTSSVTVEDIEKEISSIVYSIRSDSPAPKHYPNSDVATKQMMSRIDYGMGIELAALAEALTKKLKVDESYRS